MEFAKKYPLIQDRTNEDGLIESEEKKPCIICGKATEFIEIYSEARFCSEECMNKFYNWYDELLKKETDRDDA